MNNPGELPLARTVEGVLRLGYRMRRLARVAQGDALPEIIVSHKFGIVCAAIPLCGTRALKTFFRSNSTVDFEAELLRDTVPNVLSRHGNRRLLFSVVRAPWSRVVSCYEKRIRNAYIRPSYRGYKGIAVLSAHEGLSTTMSFEEFVEWLCGERGRDEIANRHWMSQYRFLSLSKIESEYDQIIRLESLEKELNALLARVGLPHQSISKLGSSATTGAGRLYATTREYYTAKIINAVGDRYAKDIELFRYDFP